MIKQTLDRQTLDDPADGGRPAASSDRSKFGATSTVTGARALFLAAALLSFAASVALYFSGEETGGIFVGLWVPSILALGIFITPASPKPRR